MYLNQCHRAAEIANGMAGINKGSNLGDAASRASKYSKRLAPR